MTNPQQSVVVLSRALDQTGDLLAAVHEDQLGDPTPCGDWDVATLVGHLVATPGTFLMMMHGEQPDWSAPPVRATSGWAAEFRTAADDLLHAWHQQGDEAEPSQVDMQTAELAVHGWDLSRAIGHTGSLDPEIAERGHALMSRELTPERRGSAFGPEQPVPADATPYDRLAAFAGRTV